MVELEKLLIRPEHSIREAMVHVDRGGKGIVLLVDPLGQLEATITDGDIRRAILAGPRVGAAQKDHQRDRDGGCPAHGGSPVHPALGHYLVGWRHGDNSREPRYPARRSRARA